MVVFDFPSLDIDERNTPAHRKCNIFHRSDCVYGIGVVFQIAIDCTAFGKEDDEMKRINE